MATNKKRAKVRNIGQEILDGLRDIKAGKVGRVFDGPGRLRAEATNPMREIYRELGRLGLPEADVRRALPDWWDDAAAATPAGFSEAALILARSFGLDYDWLVKLRPEASPEREDRG